VALTAAAAGADAGVLGADAGADDGAGVDAGGDTGPGLDCPNAFALAPINSKPAIREIARIECMPSRCLGFRVFFGMPARRGKLCLFTASRHYNTPFACWNGMSAQVLILRRILARDAFPMYFLYRILTAAGMFVLAPYYALRGWRRGEPASTLRERFGRVPSGIAARAGAGAGAIWIHAVSVGEVLAAKPLLDALKLRFPGRAIFVSTTTETGQRLARERLRAADGIFYFPLDWIVPVRRVLRAMRPALVIVMETEIWPNFLREARRQRVPVVFANARISTRSFARFERWKFLVGDFYERVLQDAELFLAQTPEDAARLRAMGAPEERVEITGNLKYDAEAPSLGRFGAWLKDQVGQQERWPVVVAGSVVAEEEEAVLAAYDIVQRKWNHALLVMAPRKPDRFDAAAAIAAAGGWNVVRRSAIDVSGAAAGASAGVESGDVASTAENTAKLDESADVLVLDSIGELAGIYSLADAAFVGGSLVAAAGGHNILEPAWFGRPPVFGASMENFREMADQFLAARAGIQVTSGPMLGAVWVQLIEDTAAREKTGKAAQELSQRNRGATARSLERIANVMSGEGKLA
jgi:3-deoxy-D-manno-octulosonic-acid transferase